MKLYQTFNRTNVEATKELVRLALPRKIPFHFVSTAGVAHFRSNSNLPEIFVSDSQPPNDGSDGYATSKLVCERYLEDVSKNLNLQVVIHQPTNIQGPGAEDTSIIANLVGYSVKTGAVPKVQNLGGHIQFITLDEVSSGTLAAV